MMTECLVSLINMEARLFDQRAFHDHHHNHHHQIIIMIIII